MQKLVTIALQSIQYNLKHGLVEEHLIDLLRQGWKVVSITPVGSAGGTAYSSYGHVAGWLAVVIEK